MAALTVEETFDQVEEFSVLLAAAELLARTPWEIQFTEDLRAKFKRYGSRTNLSTFQRQALERIAKS